MSGNIAAHEFAHLLGVEDKDGPNLSNSNSIDGHWAINAHATAQDFKWAVGGELEMMSRPTYAGRGVTIPPPTSSSTTVGAPFVNELWWK